MELSTVAPAKQKFYTTSTYWVLKLWPQQEPGGNTYDEQFLSHGLHSNQGGFVLFTGKYKCGLLKAHVFVF